MIQHRLSLVELILIMTIMVIVSAMVIPPLNRPFREETLDFEQKRLEALIEFGQSQASSKGSTITFWIDTEEKTYGLLLPTQGDQPAEPLKQYQIDPNIIIEIENAENPRVEISIDADGYIDIDQKLECSLSNTLEQARSFSLPR